MWSVKAVHPSIVASRTIRAMAFSPCAHHLIIAFAGWNTPACRAALPALRLPNLEALLARLTPAERDEQAADSFSPPHERALAAALGLAPLDGRIPWAALAAREAGLSPTSPGHAWALLTLCHWEVGMNDVLFDDPATLAIEAAESDALFKAVEPLFAGDGITLHTTARPGHWLAHGPAFENLVTASIDRAAGQPVGRWVPINEAKRPLLRLQNEVQMLLYTQRVNDERSARGAASINSFWLSGAGALPDDAAPPKVPPRLDTSLREAALRDDGAAWARAWRSLDAGACAELLAASRRGEPVRLTLCGDRCARSFATAPRGLGTWLRGMFHQVQIARVLETL